MMMLGGMMTPMTAEQAVTATVKLMSYPAFRMAGMMMEPSPAASAFEEPEMPAKIMLVTTLTWPRPPGRWPTMAWASRSSMLVMPAQFMRLAARTKNGMASKMKEPYWIIMRWSSMMGVTCGVRMRMGTTEKASAKEIGTRSAMRTTSVPNITQKTVAESSISGPPRPAASA